MHLKLFDRIKMMYTCTVQRWIVCTKTKFIMFNPILKYYYNLWFEKDILL